MTFYKYAFIESSLIHLFIKYLLNAYHVPYPTEHTGMNEAGHAPFLMELTFYLRVI